MCVIIIKHQKDKDISDEILRTSAIKNPHGLGVVWLDTYHISWHKSTEWDILKTDRPFIAHFRWATVGAVNVDNMHPFQCGKSNEWLMQNGTIYGLGNKKTCDTKVLADKLDKVKRNHWKHELSKHNCRFVSVNTKKKNYQIYNKADWVKHDGVWYSKDNVLKTHAIAVYGTLKQGYSNYYHYLLDATYVDSAVTIDKYPLVIDGLPYMVEEKGVGQQVEVDVFMVSDSELAEVDRLESHPNWYQRKQVDVQTIDGDIISVWIYFNPTIDIHNKQLHSSYTQSYTPNFWSPRVSTKKRFVKKAKPYSWASIDDGTRWRRGYNY
jgi:gamma-glutamylaminecyclotransferase